MVKFARKLLALTLAACMLLGTIATAAATGAEENSGIRNDSVSDLIDAGDPRTGKETPPYIAADGESILLNKENELLLYVSGRYGYDEDEVDDFVHKFEKMSSSTSYKTSQKQDQSAPAPALDLSFVTAVALDATGSGRDDHIAYLGVKDYDKGDPNNPGYDKELRLVLYNACTNITVATLSLGNVSGWVGEVNQWAYKTFFSVTAGDYDGDGDDEIACTDDNMGVQMVIISAGEDSTLSLRKGRHYNWTDLVPGSVAVEMRTAVTATGSSVERRALISLASGNLDGTGAEELAVAVSTNDPDDSDYLSGVPAAYSTQVAAVRYPLSTEAKICPTSIYTTGKNMVDEEKQDYVIHNVLYAGQICVGDVNGDRQDEIVVAGYPGKIEEDDEGDLSGAYKLTGNYDDGAGDIKYTIGLCYATLDGNSLGHSEITIDAMTPFIKEGFFASNDLLAPLSVGTAKLHGPYAKESVFAGGRIYQLAPSTVQNGVVIESFSTLYTVEFFADESTAGYTDAYVEHVISGVFAGPDPSVSNKALINEQFVFTAVEKDNSQNDYNYKVGFVSMSTDSNGNAIFYDNTATMNANGHLVENCEGGVEEDYGVAMVPVAADVDRDGILVKYKGSTYYYEDPVVEAVLQAAPYFDELGGWTDEFQGSTTYSATVSRSLIDIQGHSISFHVGWKGKWGTDLTGELEIKAGYALDVDKQHETTYTTAYTTTFTAGPEDTVVVQRTPYICYEYVRVDESGNVLPETDEAKGGSVFFMEAMHPVYALLSVDEYNQFVDEYNAMAARHDTEGTNASGNQVATAGKSYRLVKITEDILPVNATGNPENYFSSVHGGEFISQGTYALSYNGGSTSSEFDESIETSFSQVNAHGLHFEIEGVNALWGNMGAFIQSAFQDTAGWGDADLNETATGGEVANVNPNNYSADELQTLKQYSFNWRCALWKKPLMTDAQGRPLLDAKGNEIVVPIVGYVVTNVQSPMAAPTGVEAYLSGRGNQVTVEWNRSADGGGALQGYSIYRYCDNQNPVLVNSTRIAPDVTSFVDTTKLRPGKIYTYYVTAFYSTGATSYKTLNSKSSAVVWGIPLFWLNEDNDGDGDDSPGG